MKGIKGVLTFVLAFVQRVVWHVIPTVGAVTNPVETGSKTKIFLSVDGTTPADPADLIPVVGEITVRPQGQVTSVPIYGDDGWDRSVKTGMALTITFRTMALTNNAILKPVLEAAAKTNNAGAACKFVVEGPDASYWSGNGVLNQAEPDTPVRGIFSHLVTITAGSRLAKLATLALSSG